MSRLENAKKAVQRLTFYVCAGSMFVLIPMMFLTTFDVIGRAFFSRPIPGTVELSRYMLVTLILLGLAYTQQVRGHPRVNLVISRLPIKVRLVIEAVVSILGLFIVFIFVWQGWNIAFGRASSIVSDVLRIPQLPFRLMISVGGALLFLEIFIDLASALGRLFRCSPGKEAVRENSVRLE